MTLRSYADFEERLVSGLKKDMRNLTKFSPEHLKVTKLGL